MSKKRINDMSLDEIFNITGVILSAQDIMSFYKNENLVYSYIETFNKEKGSMKAMEDFLKEHEDEVDKEKLVFRTYLNYKKNIEVSEEQLKNLKVKAQYQEHSIEELENYIQLQKEMMQRIQQLDPRLDVYIMENTFVETIENGKIKKEVIFNIKSSQEEYKKRTYAEKKKLEKWEEIDETLDEENGEGMKYLMQTILLTDLSVIFPNSKIGMDLKECILDSIKYAKNTEPVKSAGELKEVVEKEAKNATSINPREYVPKMREELKRNIRFLDFDKLLLICAYRYEDCLEKGFANNETIETLKNTMIYIKELLENKNKKLEEVLQNIDNYNGENEGGELVKYSCKDIDKCIKRFIGDRYILKKEIQQAKENLEIGEQSIDEFSKEMIELFELSEDEIREIARICPQNLEFAIENLKLSEEEIVENIKNSPSNVRISNLRNLYNTGNLSLDSIINLYSDDYINRDFFAKMSKNTDIDSKLDITRINDLYLKVKQEQQKRTGELNETTKKQLEAEIELYKVINIEGKTEEELEKQANIAVKEIMDNVEDEEDLLYYYNKGLLTLGVAAEWGGDELVDRLYREQKIVMQDIERLCETRKISQEEFEKIYLETEDYTNLKKYILLGYLRGDTIKELFVQGKIEEKAFEGALVYGKINEEQYHSGIHERTKVLVGLNLDDEFSIVGFKKLAPEKNDTGDTGGKKYPETLIDPFIRKQFLDALGARPIRIKNIDRNNPFFHYNFFIILNNGTLEDNNVIIAERFYEDRLNPDEYATSNATYFFQSKDLLIENRNSKSEILENEKSTIDKVDHKLGRWGIDTMFKISEVALGKKFTKEDKKTNEYADMIMNKLKSMYSEEQFKIIASIIREIDKNPENWYEVTYEEEPNQGSNVGEDDEER